MIQVGSNKTITGFTLVELVVVIVIAGILAAYIVPRIATRSSFDERLFQDEVVSVARYAQQLAMMRGRGYTVRFSVDNATQQYGIEVQQGANPFAWTSHANGQGFPITYPNGVSTAPGSVVITYNALGSVVGNTAQAITISGAGTSLVCIEASGYAHNGGC